MAHHSYEVVDERSNVVQGSGTWTGDTIDVLRTPNILLEADLTALTGTSPHAQLVIDSSNDGVSWGNADVYSGPSYAAATAHWGYRGTITAKRYVRVRVIVTGTSPSATTTLTVLGAANS